jgi:hypothetical protein
MEDILVNLLTFAAGWVLKQPRTLAKSILAKLSKKKK